MKKLFIELFVYLSATQSRKAAVERVPLFPESYLDVLPTPQQPRPQCHSIESVGRYSEKRHVMIFIVLGIAG
jgi:hypothetical protein